VTLEAALQRIAQDWVELIPGTRPHARYHALDGSESLGSDPTAMGLDLVADRGFLFDVGSRSTIEEAGDDLARCWLPTSGSWRARSTCGARGPTGSSRC
jgi:hypothetical protein